MLGFVMLITHCTPFCSNGIRVAVVICTETSSLVSASTTWIGADLRPASYADHRVALAPTCCPFTINLPQPNGPSECDDVIRRARVSRTRGQQATAARGCSLLRPGAGSRQKAGVSCCQGLYWRFSSTPHAAMGGSSSAFTPKRSTGRCPSGEMPTAPYTADGSGDGWRGRWGTLMESKRSSKRTVSSGAPQINRRTCVCKQTSAPVRAETPLGTPLERSTPRRKHLRSRRKGEGRTQKLLMVARSLCSPPRDALVDTSALGSIHCDCRSVTDGTAVDLHTPNPITRANIPVTCVTMSSA